MKIYQVPYIADCITKVSAYISTFDPAILEIIKTDDLSDIEVSDNCTIIYNDTEYNPDELFTILETQIKIAQKPNYLRSLYDGSVVWFLRAVIATIFTLSNLYQTFETFNDLYPKIQAAIERKNISCFTIKEHAFLRKEANSKSPHIYLLPYDTKLEILNKIPRWYLVKYTDREGNEIIGWISKISVELDR